MLVSPFFGFFFFFFFFFFFVSFAKFVSPLDAGVRAPELVIPEGAVGFVQAASFQDV